MKLRYLLLAILLTFFTGCMQNTIDVQKDGIKAKTYDIKGKISKVISIIFPVAYAAQEDFCVNKEGSKNYVEAYAVFADDSEKLLCSANIDVNGNYELNLKEAAINGLAKHYLKFKVVHSKSELDGLILAGVEKNLEVEADIYADKALQSIPKMAKLKVALSTNKNLIDVDKDFDASFDDVNVFKLFKTIVQDAIVDARSINKDHYKYLSDVKDSVLKIVEYSIVNSTVSDPIKAGSADIKAASMDIQCALIFDYTETLYVDGNYVETCAKQLENNDKQVFETQFKKFYDIIVSNMSKIEKSTDTKDLITNLDNFKNALSAKNLVKTDIEALNALPFFQYLYKSTTSAVENSIGMAQKVKSVSEYLTKTKEHRSLTTIVEVSKLGFTNNRSISINSFYTLAKRILEFIEADTKMNPDLVTEIFTQIKIIIDKYNSKKDDELLAGTEPYKSYHSKVLENSTTVLKDLPSQKDLGIYYSNDKSYNGAKDNILAMLNYIKINSMNEKEYMISLYKDDFATLQKPTSATEGVNALNNIIKNLQTQTNAKTKYDELKKNYPNALDSFIKLSDIGVTLSIDFKNWVKSQKSAPTDKQKLDWFTNYSKHDDFISLYSVMMDNLK